MNNFRRSMLATLILFLLGITSCASLPSAGPTEQPKPVPNIPTSGPAQPRFGGSVIIGIQQDPGSLLPQQDDGSGWGVLVLASFWSPLFYGDNNGVILPGLATEVPTVANGGISGDFKTYTIHLRPGLKWSDGVPLTAEDVVYSINLYSNAAYGATSGFPGDEIASVTATDETSVVLTLKKVDVAFIAQYMTDPAASPLPKHVYATMSPADVSKSSQAFQPPVSSGPFVIKERVHGDHITLVKNPYYFRAPKPYLDSGVFNIIPDTNTMMTALKSGSIDTARVLDINQLDIAKEIPGYRVVMDKLAAQSENLYFNLQNPFLADLRVRKALTMAIDPTPLMERLWKGTAVLACDDDLGTFANEPELIPCYKYDPAAAKALLETAGFTMGSEGYYNKDGKVLELRWSTTAGRAYREQTQMIVQDQLKKIGIKIKIVNYPGDTFFGSILPDGDFDIAEFFWGPGYDPDMHTHWNCGLSIKNGGYNVTGFCDPKIDQANAVQLSNPDQAVRKAALHTVHQTLIEQVPVMFLYGFRNFGVARETIQNYAPSHIGPTETWNIWDWWRTDA